MIDPQGLCVALFLQLEGPFRRLESGSSPNRWAERLHANTRSMIMPPAESLLGNVIHHPAAAAGTDSGGGIERHSIAQIDGWLRIALASLLYIPELILINVVIGQRGSPCTCVSGPSEGEINARSCGSSGMGRC